MIYVGIDVAKSKHSCCILSSDGEVLSAFDFTNSKDGFLKLISEISGFSCQKGFSDVKIGLESTGHYSLNLTNYLLQKRSR